MNRRKGIFLLAAGILLLAGVMAAVCAGLGAAPAVNHALRISELLQPVTEADQLAMHVAVSAKINSETVDLESDVTIIAGAEPRFLILEQRGITLYVADNVLFLENGRAFRLGDAMQTHAASYAALLPRIGALFDQWQITAEQTEEGAVYEITVTGEAAEQLLAVVSPAETLPVAGIRELKLALTEKRGVLEEIRFSGAGRVNGTAVAILVELSGFRFPVSGEDPVPEAVRQRAATVDPGELFSLTEDLYRLVLAIEPLAHGEPVAGNLSLAVDCGPLQMDTELNLSELQTDSGQIDPEQLRALPEMLALICMEGDIRCTFRDGSYVYGLELDRQSMQELARMILPELEQYGSSLTGGSVTVVVKNNKVVSMNVSIGGAVRVMLVQLPISVTVEFSFD